MSNDEWVPMTRRQRYWSDVRIGLGLGAWVVAAIILTVQR